MGKKPAMRGGGTAGEPLRAVARAILEDARSAIEDLSRTEAVAVHDFRKAMKRWRALLRLLEPYLGESGRRCGSPPAISHANSRARATHSRR
jgi:CHAD domain-containing protein